MNSEMAAELERLSADGYTREIVKIFDQIIEQTNIVDMSDKAHFHSEEIVAAVLMAISRYHHP